MLSVYKNIVRKDSGKNVWKHKQCECYCFLKSEMEQIGAEVKTDLVNVPLWLPGSSSLYYMDEAGRKNLNVIPLGLSVGTGGKELNLKVVEFKNK